MAIRLSVSDLSEHLLVDGEGELQGVLDVIVLHPLQALVELLVQVLQITQLAHARDTGLRR